ncbi:hypothetical protein FE257_002463 [Aspergillus nanangensis]|uniref:Nitronate monooxygenase domain-containing protein n=1 Tax=Aspergillus nanangensis TaxID=2582783 RepID=A0AAD4CT76_ASPNN|nr:hypothetical protein FE257_002463 [Aspergillus nanangensis]
MSPPPLIVNAPMYGYADGQLAAAVSAAGGYGFIAGGYNFTTNSPQLDKLQHELDTARSILQITSPDDPLPIGVGCLTVQADGIIQNVLPILLKARVTGIWLSFPQHGTDHGPIITAVQELRQANAWDVSVYVQVGTVNAAREALEVGADVLVVQGSDAGGHQWAQGASIIALLPEVGDMVREVGKSAEIRLLAAGGIVDARGVVAAIALGADGVVMGTRFIATVECSAPDTAKQQILSAVDGGSATVKSRKHDVFQSTDFWPIRYDGRAIIGPCYKEYAGGIADEEVIRRHNEAKENGEAERTIIWAGAGIGSIRKIVSVAELLQTIYAESKLAVTRLNDAFGI